MSTTNNDSLLSFLKSVKCGNPFFPNGLGSVVFVNQKDKITDAFQKLIQHRILSVPVVDDNGVPKNVFSILDFVNHMVKLFPEEDLKGLNAKKTSDFFFHYADLRERKLEVKSEQVGEVLQKELKEIETLDPVFMVDEGAELLEAVKIIMNTKAHRVLVVNHSNGKLGGVVSQSRLLEFIGTTLPSLKEASQTVEQLNLGLKEVITINENKMAISAFKLMREKQVSAVGVVNDSGVLVGNISANDLKLVDYDLNYFTCLSTSVREYILWVDSNETQKSPTSIRSQMLRSHEPKGNNLGLVTCKLNNTLEFVIKTLSYYRIHRMYVLDDDKRPIGVITIHDIIAKLMNNRGM